MGYLTKIILMLSVMLSFSCFAKNHFIVGVEDINYAPLYSIQDNSYSGFSKDLLDAFAKKHNYQFTYRPLPLVDLFDSFLSQRVDFKFPDHPIWKASSREGIEINYSKGLINYTDGVMLFVDNKSNSGNHSLKRLGIINGFTPFGFIDAVVNNRLSTIQANDLDQLVELLLKGEVDGIYYNVEVAKHYLKTIDKAEEILFDEQLAHSQGEYHLSTILYPEVVKELDVFMQTELALIKALKEKHQIK